MNDHHRIVAQLIGCERPLTDGEQQYLVTFADDAWAHIRAQMNERAQNAYAIASPDEFAECINQHMSPDEGTEMVAADTYHCPVCARHLKDRHTPVATSVLIERRRLRELYQAIDGALPGAAREAATARFIAALGWS